MNQASISKAQTISCSSNIHKSCEFRLYTIKICSIYYLDVSQGGQRKPRLTIWISLLFFFLDLAQNACCVGVLMGCKWMTKALCYPVYHLMSNSSTLHWCCVLQLLYFVLKEKILPVCLQEFVCVAWVFVCLFLLYGSLPMWFVPFYTDCLWVIYDSNI